MSGLVARPPSMGRIFFVDGVDGLDTNNGIDPGTPWKTIEKALDNCLAARNDYIIVLNYPAAGGIETEPIVVDKTWVSIVGHGWTGEKPQIGIAGDTAVFDIQANMVTIRNFRLIGGASDGAIVCSIASAHSCQVLDCEFTPWGTSGYGIYGRPQPGGNSFPRLVVLRCRFGGQPMGVISNDGIYIGLNSTQGLIQGNLFDGISGIAINCPNGLGPGCQILDNLFILPSDTTRGKAITLGATSSNNIIDGNHAAYLIATPYYNPYVDVAHSSHWGLNYKGSEPVPPV